jgi:low temperature requirement protein LtrA
VNSAISPVSFVRSLAPRDPHQDHRVSSPLELLTDLCFVVAVAQAGNQLHHALAEGLVGHGVLGFAMAFFAIWWAWLNFTWFGSAYDNDDVVYRLLTILQIIGVLVLAAGIPQIFDGNFVLGVIGYVIMRIALVLQWLRAARGDLERRRTCLRYAAGVSVVQVLWVGYLLIPHSIALPVFFVLIVLDMAVPAWAERTGITPWHPEHIADRYGAFYIIVLGETILASTMAIQSALNAAEHGPGHALVVVIGGVLIVFSVWWLYFARDASAVLGQVHGQGTNFEFVWGLGHYFIFASGAAIGAGLAVRAEYWTHPEEISGLISAAAVTVPIAVLLAALWFIQLRRHDPSMRAGLPFAAAIVLVLATTFTEVPEVLAGLVLAALVVVEVRLAATTTSKLAVAPAH